MTLLKIRSLLIALTIAGSLIVSTLTVSMPAMAQIVPEGGVMRTIADDPFFSLSRIDIPAPSRIRTAVGTPGPDYWQQRADYQISATLDTATKTVAANMRLTYTNNSPDTLHFLWLQLDQNLYAPGSKGTRVYPSGSRWGVRDAQGGYTLSDIRVNGKPAQYHIDDTMLRIELAAPLRPHGKTVTVSMGFRFIVPEHGSDRMARDGALYEIAQWYPRMAVYDDVRGWNTDPYLGQGEFYLEYGDIEFNITAPAGYTIAATGVLKNAGDVLTETQRDRLAHAARDTGVVAIITHEEAAARQAAAVPGTKTWRFEAHNVRDVAWAGAPDFSWDATNCSIPSHAILCHAYYQLDKAGIAWAQGAEQTRFSTRLYSELIMPYPYPQNTVVAGPVGGMEYPMFSMVEYANPKDDPTSIFATVDHEHGHNWFPMVVGSNERRYAWMDEGLNMFMNTFALERRYAGTKRGIDVYPSYIRNWRSIHERGIDYPLMTRPDHIGLASLGAIGYRKPAAVLHLLRNVVLGEKVFDNAFRSYARAWSFKHPTPGDFFRHMEAQTGADLSWFWRSFFYTTGVIDVQIADVSNRQDQDGNTFAVIRLRNVSGVPFPVQLRVKYASGATEDLAFPVDIWGSGMTFDAVLDNPERVIGVTLWPDPIVPDWHLHNKTWGDAPPKDPPGPVTR